MKLFASPIPAPAIDANYIKNWQQVEDIYVKAVEDKLRKLGYSSANTGQTIRFSVADGYAVYMVVHSGSFMGLVHLALGDGYSIPAAHIRGLTKKDVLNQISYEKKLEKLFK